MEVDPTGAGLGARQREMRVMLLGRILPVLKLMGGDRGWGEAEVDLHAGCAPCFSPWSPAKVWASWP